MRTALLSLLCGIIFIGAFSWGAQAQATERKLITPNTANSTEKSQVSTDSITSIPTFTLKGQVTDVYGQPIPYVRILHEGTTNLTGTDNTGKFSTEVYAYERLVIFHTGYVEQRITVQPGDSLTHIKMYPEVPHLTGINIEAVSSAKQTKESNGIEYFFGDDLPSFRCDYQKFIEKHLRYPETARKAGIEGEVIASFVIDTEGNITYLCIVRPVSPELDAEALRVIALLPQCKPARHRGKPIPFRYTIGIDFKLKTAGHTQADTLPLPGR